MIITSVQPGKSREDFGNLDDPVSEDNANAQVRDVSKVDPGNIGIYEGNQTQIGLLLERKKNRCIRTILGNKERDIDPYIDEETSARFRKVVLDEINGLAEFVKDVLVSNETVVVNDLYIQRMEALQENVEAIRNHILGD